jgi:hypothetical protein
MFWIYSVLSCIPSFPILERLQYPNATVIPLEVTTNPLWMLLSTSSCKVVCYFSNNNIYMVPLDSISLICSAVKFCISLEIRPFANHDPNALKLGLICFTTWHRLTMNFIASTVRSNVASISSSLIVVKYWYHYLLQRLYFYHLFLTYW